ncbi:MAG: efflux RND transporter periplasmic adaptor subunit [Muribaculaceae bacterium]|nr:efflux RND transporter periplasmic adaptor subunit [Muribaculaceae bacterium]
MRLHPIFAAILVSAWGLTSCGGSAHDGHDHDHEQHDHDHEDHDEHDHDHEARGHDHDHTGHADEIKLSEEMAAKFGVECETIAPAPFHETVTVSGRIQPAASGQSVIAAPRAGKVSLFSGLTPGMKVTSGQAVATVSPEGLAGGDNQRAAIATRDAARAELKRIEPLYKEGIVSAADYNAARRALAEAEAAAGSAPAGPMRATSPKGGAVTQVLVRQGEYVELGQPIAVVSSDSRLTLRADVPERHHSILPTVHTANFRPDYSGNVLSLEKLNGHLSGAPGATPSENGYIPVYFTFDNDGSVVPGSFAEVTLIGASRAEALSVPRSAIVEIQGNKYVYTRMHDDAYSKHLVTTGRSDGYRVEILSGLQPGAEVVTRGAGVVRMAETSNVAPPGHSHNH